MLGLDGTTLVNWLANNVDNAAKGGWADWDLVYHVLIINQDLKLYSTMKSNRSFPIYKALLL